MWAVLRYETDFPVAVTEGNELLVEHGESYWGAVRLGQLVRQQRRQPEAPKDLAHRRARAGTRQKLNIGSLQHGSTAPIARPVRAHQRVLGKVYPQFTAFQLPLAIGS